MKKIVVIGGGTGTFVTLSALKKIPDLDLSAIVTVADSGGSTGRLRDEFGFLPVGDLRQALAAMATPDNWIRELLLYRFAKGRGLEGHNLGNLILTALQDMTGSTARAIEIASMVFRLQGHIYPITTKNIQLVIEYQDGTVEIGEHILDDVKKHGGERIISLKTSPRARIYRQARQTIENAEVIIIGPGDLYGSILPNFVIQGTSAAIERSKAKFIFVMNLMTRYTQTHQLSASEHLKLVESYSQRAMDYVIVNTGSIPEKLLSAYRKQHEYPVEDDLKDLGNRKVIRRLLVKKTLVKKQKGDRIQRSYLRHNPLKLARLLERRIL